MNPDERTLTPRNKSYPERNYVFSFVICVDDVNEDFRILNNGERSLKFLGVPCRLCEKNKKSLFSKLHFGAILKYFTAFDEKVTLYIV